MDTSYIQGLVEAEINALRQIPISPNFARAVDLIHSHVHVKGGKLVCSGIGKAGEIAHSISTTFSSTGTPAVYLRPSEAQHGDIGLIQPNDVLLLVSNSGKTKEVLDLVYLIRNLYHDIPVIAITGHPDSILGELAEITLYTGNPQEICPLGLTPTTSTTTMAVIGDILVVMMMKKIGFTKEEYAKRHHGGYLGEKSRG